MPSNSCCNYYPSYILAFRITVTAMFFTIVIVLMQIPVKLPEPSGRSSCSDAIHGPNSHALPNTTCEVKTLAERSIIEIGDEGSCQLVMTGSEVLIELVSQDLLTVSYCTDGVYAYGDVQSGKYIHLDLGRCGASEFIFEISSAGNSSIAYLSQTSTRGIINPFCRTIEALLVFYIMPFVIFFTGFSSLGACVEEGILLDERMEETSCYRTMVCCSGVLCIECCVRKLIDPPMFADCQDRLRHLIRGRFSSFQTARSGELPVPPQLEMEPV